MALNRYIKIRFLGNFSRVENVKPDLTFPKDIILPYRLLDLETVAAHGLWALCFLLSWS